MPGLSWVKVAVPVVVATSGVTAAVVAAGDDAPAATPAVAAWIDAPLDGAELAVGEIVVKAHVEAGSATSIDLVVDGEQVATDDELTRNGSLAFAEFAWNATSGAHDLIVESDSGQSAVHTVFVGGLNAAAPTTSSPISTSTSTTTSTSTSTTTSSTTSTSTTSSTTSTTSSSTTTVPETTTPTTVTPSTAAPTTAAPTTAAPTTSQPPPTTAAPTTTTTPPPPAPTVSGVTVTDTGDCSLAVSATVTATTRATVRIVGPNTGFDQTATMTVSGTTATAIVPIFSTDDFAATVTAEGPGGATSGSAATRASCKP